MNKALLTVGLVLVAIGILIAISEPSKRIIEEQGHVERQPTLGSQIYVVDVAGLNETIYPNFGLGAIISIIGLFTCSFSSVSEAKEEIEFINSVKNGRP